jgi:S-DNA-T family DNA segregation ATPase FtsK/SpoIIIE
MTAATQGMVRGSASVGARAARLTHTAASSTFEIARLWVRWVARHGRFVFWVVLAAALLAMPLGQPGKGRALVMLGLLPGMVAAVWDWGWPVGYERVVAGPSRRWGWRHRARRIWPRLARECGLSVQRNVRRRSWSLAPKRDARLLLSTTSTASEWVHPRLMDVLTKGDTLTLRVRARMGQTLEDLEKAAPAFAAAFSAVSYRVKVWTPSALDVDLVMREALAHSADAVVPIPLGHDLTVDTVTLGRRQDGTAWALQVRGRHTLVVGCSGSGKGSMLWGVCGGLAPAVRADLVRLWGVDLKRGVEVMMGRALFTTVAITPTEATATLCRLLQVVEERGRSMAGVSRLHTPRPGDPLHVLVIDELAALTAYADVGTKREASRLLSEVLTQGRALGVVVLACVQDPRKEVVGMRGLFTQTIALRLRSPEETRMVLGDGTAALAPAHRLSPAAPGSAWVVEEDGTLDRVRADYWPDELVRQTAATYPALVVEETVLASDAPVPLAGDVPVDAEVDSSEDAHSARVQDFPTGRKPRSPRKPRARQPRQTAGADAGGLGPEAA